jgi:hypothetical protein
MLVYPLLAEKIMKKIGEGWRTYAVAALLVGYAVVVKVGGAKLDEEVVVLLVGMGLATLRGAVGQREKKQERKEVNTHER